MISASAGSALLIYRGRGNRHSCSCKPVIDNETGLIRIFGRVIADDDVGRCFYERKRVLVCQRPFAFTRLETKDVATRRFPPIELPVRLNVGVLVEALILCYRFFPLQIFKAEIEAGDDEEKFHHRRVVSLCNFAVAVFDLAAGPTWAGAIAGDTVECAGR